MQMGNPSQEEPPAILTSGDLTALVDLLQTAPSGSTTLDAQIDAVLGGSAFDEPGADGPRGRQAPDDGSAAGPAVRWSEDLTALLRRAPPAHNFTLGERDGVRWAWIQPNDGWTPGPHELRHDHPRGSGLIVACTLPLAMAAALVKLRARPGRQASRAIHGDRSN